jgi:hypothetical protein
MVAERRHLDVKDVGRLLVRPAVRVDEEHRHPLTGRQPGQRGGETWFDLGHPTWRRDGQEDPAGEPPMPAHRRLADSVQVPLGAVPPRAVQFRVVLLSRANGLRTVSAVPLCVVPLQPVGLQIGLQSQREGGGRMAGAALAAEGDLNPHVRGHRDPKPKVAVRTGPASGRSCCLVWSSTAAGEGATFRDRVFRCLDRHESVRSVPCSTQERSIPSSPADHRVTGLAPRA